MKDLDCPTCGSKKIRLVKDSNEENATSLLQMKCDNCKKFWFAQK